MRRRTILALGLLLASAAMPQEAQARRNLLGDMVGALTSAIRGVGPGRHYRGRVHHRRIVRSPRSRPTATVAAPAVAGAAAATAATATAATTTAADPKITEVTGTTGSATSGEPQAALPPARTGRLGVVGPL